MGRKKKGSFQHISNAQPASGTASDALYSFKVDYVAIGNKLRAQRKRLGYTQEQVAEAIGITPAFMGHIERGERGMALDTLLHLCNFYHITMDYLWSDTLPPNEQQLASQIAVMLKDKTPEQQAAVMDIVRTVTIHM
ncbi:MAG: helix-turn-helix transcriptional regulator [Clostridiales bacterium]|nr:helix-turn-helix transcriptional regulator [Clostridiales bacterium]